MEPSWHVVIAGLGPLAPLSPALERAFAYERMQRSLWFLLPAQRNFRIAGDTARPVQAGFRFFYGVGFLE